MTQWKVMTLVEYRGCDYKGTEKKVLWWNWGRKLEWSGSRAQKERARITDPKRVTETVNQKAVQRREARDIRQTFKPLKEV